jgi:hypothetical protein
MNDNKLYEVEPSLSEVLYNAVSGIMGTRKATVRKRWKRLLNTGDFYLEEDLFSLKDLQTGAELIRCSFKEGFCVDVTLFLCGADQYDSFMEGIKAEGFKYSRYRRWELPEANHLWRVEKNSPDEYLAVCRRLRPVKTVMTRIAA